MKTFIFVLIIALAGVVYSQNDIKPQNGEAYEDLYPLPGLDLVGYGYDIRYDNIKSGLLAPLVDYTYMEKRMYTYPVFREVTYQVPDQVAVRTLANTNAYSYVFSNITEMQDVMSRVIGVDNTETDDKSVEALTCIKSAPIVDVPEGGEEDEDNTRTPSSAPIAGDVAENETCVAKASVKYTQIFSTGATFNYLKDSFSQFEQHMVINEENTQMFDILLDIEPFLRYELRSDIAKVSENSFVDLQKPYFDFFEKYGTHFVMSAVMGGSIKMTSSIRKQVTGTTERDIEGEKNGEEISKTEALAGATSAFQQSITGDRTVTNLRTTRNLATLSSSTFELKGGDSSMVNLLDARDRFKVFYDWKQTIYNNPAPVGLRLMEITKIFDRLRQPDVAKALEIYLNFDTKSIGIDNTLTITQTNIPKQLPQYS